MLHTASINRAMPQKENTVLRRATDGLDSTKNSVTGARAMRKPTSSAQGLGRAASPVGRSAVKRRASRNRAAHSTTSTTTHRGLKSARMHWMPRRKPRNRVLYPPTRKDSPVCPAAERNTLFHPSCQGRVSFRRLPSWPVEVEKYPVKAK